MNNFKEICKALLDEIPYESPTTCLAREALLNDDSSSRPTAKELQNLWQICNSPSVFAHAVLERWGNLRAEPVPVSEKPLTDEQIIERLRAESESRASDLWNSLIRAKVPVPVSEKPWERPGWCDKRGRCWWSTGGVARTGAEIDFNTELPMAWWLVRSPESCITGKILPFDAIPFFDRNNETGGEQ